MVRAQPAGTGCNGYVHLGLMYGFRASFDKTGTHGTCLDEQRGMIS
jgi:hypothetical protein